MDLTTTRLSALSRLFSASVFRELVCKGQSPLFTRLIDQIGLIEQFKPLETVGDAFDSAFTILRRLGLRDEYVFRAAITHNILLGRHSLNTASMLTEFRAGSCKADLVILNGTATVYEIKSDRDSLARLPNQIANYKKVFAKIYVIASAKHVPKVMDVTSPDVGVMSLVRWNRIHIEREAVDRSRLVFPIAIFESLRLPEAKAVLRELNLPVPTVPNTMMHGAIREIFARLEPSDVHSQMVKVLKGSRTLAPLDLLVGQLPASVQPAAFSTRMKRADHERLVEAMRTPLNDAMAWGN